MDCRNGKSGDEIQGDGRGPLSYDDEEVAARLSLTTRAGLLDPHREDLFVLYAKLRCNELLPFFFTFF